MIDRAAATYLWDARHAAERIGRFTAGRDFDDYLADEMMSAAVERQFEIIGEALTRLHRLAPQIANKIPDLRQIIGFRNALIHGYHSVDPNEVWSTVQNDLPQLHEAIARLLDAAPKP